MAATSGNDWAAGGVWKDENGQEYPDEFYMFSAKIVRCTRNDPHPFAACPFLHPREPAARRDPRVFSYKSTPCFDLEKNGVCRRGINCPFTHNLFEYFLHPSRYRTSMCMSGPSCKRNLCFFAHSDQELRHKKPEAGADTSRQDDRQLERGWNAPDSSAAAPQAAGGADPGATAAPAATPGAAASDGAHGSSSSSSSPRVQVLSAPTLPGAPAAPPAPGANSCPGLPGGSSPTHRFGASRQLQAAQQQQQPRGKAMRLHQQQLEMSCDLQQHSTSTSTSSSSMAPIAGGGCQAAPTAAGATLAAAAASSYLLVTAAPNTPAAYAPPLWSAQGSPAGTTSPVGLHCSGGSGGLVMACVVAGGGGGYASSAAANAAGAGAGAQHYVLVPVSGGGAQGGLQAQQQQQVLLVDGQLVSMLPPCLPAVTAPEPQHVLLVANPVQ